MAARAMPRPAHFLPSFLPRCRLAQHVTARPLCPFPRSAFALPLPAIAHASRVFSPPKLAGAVIHAAIPLRPIRTWPLDLQEQQQMAFSFL